MSAERSQEPQKLLKVEMGQIGPKNIEQQSGLLGGLIITRSILLSDFSLYQRAGNDMGFKILRVAKPGETFFSSRRTLIMQPGKNGVPHLAARYKLIELTAVEGNLGISIQRPKSREDFKTFERRLMELREQSRRQNGSEKTG